MAFEYVCSFFDGSVRSLSISAFQSDSEAHPPSRFQIHEAYDSIFETDTRYSCRFDSVP
jgi:hypothetical protein